MRPTKNLNVTLLACLGLGLTACSILAPQPDLSRFYTVAASSELSGTLGAGAMGRTYSLAQVKIAPYLERMQVAKRVSGNEVSYSETARWAEPLDAGITRVLLQDLSTVLGTERILITPWPGNGKVSYHVAVEILRFEALSTGAGLLSARWSVRDGSDGKILVVRQTDITRPASGKSVEATVAALSLALGDLSREIAGAIGLGVPPSKG